MNAASIDQDESNFLGDYLAWARKARVRGTLMPVIIYRGHADSTWELKPTICRSGFPSSMIQQTEREIVDEYRLRFSLTGWSDIDVLAYARHHAAPTRLLDWSQDPLTALWFCVEMKQHDQTDGRIFQLLSHVAKKHVCIALKFKLENAEACKCKKSVHMLQCAKISDRATNQKSVFTITSLEADLFMKPLENIIPIRPEEGLRSFIIPAAMKKKLRVLLSDLHLDAYSIYGGPDGLGKSIAMKFDASEYPNMAQH